ncbi:MAG: hypothetical protein M3463_09220 [Verrucomicrobiota bacterium]|nr:hypothetical protein [Verrucomicrobiota bacterium]
MATRLNTFLSLSICLGASATLAQSLRAQTPRRVLTAAFHGCSVYTVRGGWNVSPRWKLFAAVQNITSEDYRVQGSGLDEPGTNVVLSSELRF